MNHLLAGLVSLSLVDEVCDASTSIMLRDINTQISAQEFKAMWMANIQATEEFPAVVETEAESLEIEALPKSKRSIHRHPRLEEYCPSSSTVHNCPGRPLRNMKTPPLFRNSMGHRQIVYQISDKFCPHGDTSSPPPVTSVLSAPSVNTSDFPRIIALLCTIPIQGAPVYVQMSDTSVHILHVSQGVDKEIFWSGMELESSCESSCCWKHLPQPRGFNCLPLRACVIPYQYPKSCANGITIKLRKKSGEEISLCWPFFQRPGQSREDLMKELRGIAALVPTARPKSRLDSYEVAVALESHGIYEYADNTISGTGVSVDVNAEKGENDSVPEKSPPAVSKSLGTLDQNTYDFGSNWNPHNQANQEKSIHDILMGDSDDESDDGFEHGKRYSRYDHYIDEVGELMHQSSFEGENFNLHEASTENVIDLSSKRNKKRKATSDENNLEKIKMALAEQIYFAEYEAEKYFSSKKTFTKARIVRESDSPDTNDAIENGDESDDPTAIPLSCPKSTIIGISSSMGRHTNEWRVRLDHVHCVINKKAYICQDCKIVFALPDFLSSK